MMDQQCFDQRWVGWVALGCVVWVGGGVRGLRWVGQQKPEAPWHRVTKEVHLLTGNVPGAHYMLGGGIWGKGLSGQLW